MLFVGDIDHFWIVPFPYSLLTYSLKKYFCFPYLSVTKCVNHVKSFHKRSINYHCHCYEVLFQGSYYRNLKRWYLGSSVPMPPELLELYQLYQQELANRNEKEANYLSELNVMLRVEILLNYCFTINYYHFSPHQCCHWEDLNLNLATEDFLQSDMKTIHCFKGKITEKTNTWGRKAD